MNKETEQGYERAQDNEIEARKLLADAQQAAIDLQVSEQIKDVEIVGDIIEQEADLFAEIFVKNKDCTDIGVDFRVLMKHILENQIREHM